VTISTGRAEPDGDAASPALRKLLNLDQNQAGQTPATPTNANVTVRADVRTSDGARFIREALVSFGSEGKRPFRIREWRHGDVDADELAFSTQTQYSAGGGESSCLWIEKAVGS
jgi:general secretion pathway protein K